MQTLVGFPNYISTLGGAVSLRLGKRVSKVQLNDGTVVRVKTSEIEKHQNDGLILGHIARAAIAKTKGK